VRIRARIRVSVVAVIATLFFADSAAQALERVDSVRTAGACVEIVLFYRAGCPRCERGLVFLDELGQVTYWLAAQSRIGGREAFVKYV
jgi:hypothetical protein